MHVKLIADALEASHEAIFAIAALQSFSKLIGDNRIVEAYLQLIAAQQSFNNARTLMEAISTVMSKHPATYNLVQLDVAIAARRPYQPDPTTDLVSKKE